MIGSATATTTTTAANASATGSNTITAPGGDLGQNAFLNLLITQIQNQDPTQPMDNTQTIAELAQFSALEQMQQVNTNLNTLTSTVQSYDVTNLIGQSITAQGADNSPSTTGTVSGIVYQNGLPELQVGNSTIDPSLITSIK